MVYVICTNEDVRILSELSKPFKSRCEASAVVMSTLSGFSLAMTIACERALSPPLLQRLFAMRL